MTKLPTTQGSGSPGGLPALDEGIARLRQAMGKPERRVIFCACSVRGDRFSVVNERTDPRRRFTISAVEKLAPDSAGATGSGVSAKVPDRRPEPEAFNAEDFDYAGFVCPWCGDSSGQTFHDRCGVNYCGGARTRDSSGVERFHCPACNESFKLVTADLIHGSSTAIESAKAAANRLIEEAKRKLLPKWRK